MIPKPTKKPKKKLRETNEKYLRWIHGWPCVVCGHWPVHAHHVDRKSQLGSDLSCIPLCSFHHVGGKGVHDVGVDTFQERHGIDFDDLVKEFNGKYDDKVAGPQDEFVPRGQLKSF